MTLDPTETNNYLEGLDLGEHNKLPDNAELVPESERGKPRDTAEAEWILEQVAPFQT